MNKRKIMMAAIFCLMLSGCSLVSLLLPDKEISVTENRELQQRPKLTKKRFLNGKFQAQYETYLNDQFCLRDQWVTLATGIQAFLGRKDINGVYLGRDGYLLEKNDVTDFDKEQVKENTGYLSKFLNDMTEAYGKEHVSCLMIPSKALALPDRLPAFAEIPYQDQVLGSLRRQLSDPGIMLDLCDEMQKHQKEYIYYRTDHHWTALGAYYAYAAWAQMTGQVSAHPLEYYQRETVFTDFYGTTYNKVHACSEADSVELFHSAGEKGVKVDMDDGELLSDTMYFPKEASQGFNRYNLFFSKNTFKIEVNTKAKTGKTLLLIKDSFANCFVPFLTEDFDQIVMIDYRYGKMAVGRILDEYEDITDVLVLFNTEKFMQNKKLEKLSDTERKGGTMEEFKLEDFLE